MNTTGTWQVWDCGDLIGTFTNEHDASACRTDRLDMETHDWPHLGELTSRCICIVPIRSDGTSRGQRRSA
ncbi:hypothetical protein [Ornithinimicrobium cavernae]|uniref:hypothetical protein n=1 Tax=Ornithinimicrobium cavernae TaxID=2666047 RepID=UPI00137B0A1C|nr:hypothetical protein [Ornithinimicrobium cavernae]